MSTLRPGYNFPLWNANISLQFMLLSKISKLLHPRGRKGNQENQGMCVSMMYMHVPLLFSFKSCPALCDLIVCSPPGSSVHGILKARMLEWVAISFSRGSFRPRDGTHVSFMAVGFSTTESLGKPVHMCTCIMYFYATGVYLNISIRTEIYMQFYEYIFSSFSLVGRKVTCLVQKASWTVHIPGYDRSKTKLIKRWTPT